MKVLLLVNGYASSVTARSRVLIQSIIAENHDVQLALTSRRGHASRLARGAASTGTEIVFVLGGDGTLNEAANGLAGSDCALAPLPGGSTNVFARTLGIPDDPLEAVRSLLSAIDTNQIRSVGLGEVGGRYFLFHCGMGFDAAVVQQVERKAALKRYAGHPLFIWAGFNTWLNHYDRSSPKMSAKHGDKFINDSYFTVVLNTNPYTYLGHRPLSLAPAATLDNGLSLVVLRTMAFKPVMSVVKNLVSGKQLQDSNALHLADNLPEIEITGHKPFPYQLDGDFLGEVSSLKFTWVPEKLRLVCPPLT
jgi:diacylglycerol kinase family enzyme